MVKTKQSGKPIDFSIIPSFKCNLECWFCMYDCGPNNEIKLDYWETLSFISEFDWNKINAFGFYGGEPSIEMDLYQDFISMIPSKIPRFVITNGVWSNDLKFASAFLTWCSTNRLHIIVSGTPEHIANQDREYLEYLNRECPNGLELKKADVIHAQGRAKNYDNVSRDCEYTCQRSDRNMRLGLRPDGNVIFQNCHGEYHTIQTYKDGFNGMYEKAIDIFTSCYKLKSTQKAG